MDPDVWGPPTWKLLHGLVELYIPQLHSSYQFLFYSLAAVLPCQKCRNNYVLKLVEQPFPCKRSIGTVRNWLIDVHNAVNQDLSKKRIGRAAAHKLIKQNMLPVRKQLVVKVLDFIALNWKTNAPPESYKAGMDIFQKHLEHILHVRCNMSFEPVSLD